MNTRRSIVGLLLFSLAVAFFAGLVYFRSSPAKTPPAFVGRTDLAAALGQSKASGKPVLAFATADWCGPCQALKRGALLDPAVAAFINDRTAAVYVDIDAHPGDAQSLTIHSIPTLVVLVPAGEGAKEVSRITGNIPPADLLDWLTSACNDAAKPPANAPLSPGG